MSEWWGRLKTKYGETVEQFGWIAFCTYFALFFATLFGFWVAIRMGFEPQGAAAGAGTIGAAYVATKLTQPVRILLTIVITPLLAALLGRRAPAPAPPSPP